MILFRVAIALLGLDLERLFYSRPRLERLFYLCHFRKKRVKMPKYNKLMTVYMFRVVCPSRRPFRVVISAWASRFLARPALEHMFYFTFWKKTRENHQVQQIDEHRCVSCSDVRRLHEIGISCSHSAGAARQLPSERLEQTFYSRTVSRYTKWAKIFKVNSLLLHEISLDILGFLWYNETAIGWSHRADERKKVRGLTQAPFFLRLHEMVCDTQRPRYTKCYSMVFDVPRYDYTKRLTVFFDALQSRYTKCFMIHNDTRYTKCSLIFYVLTTRNGLRYTTFNYDYTKSRRLHEVG